MKKQQKRVRKRVMALCLSTAMIVSLLPMGGHAAAVSGNQTVQADVYPYMDTNLSFEERAADLVSRLTLEEKCSQLKNGSSPAPGIPRLGVSPYLWWKEALHGVANQGRATSFPTGLSIGSTWNPDLIQDMSSAISDEAREKINGVEEGGTLGLSYWSPTINLNRDPRWGRSEETYGEDPFLTSEIAGGFVRGLQGEGEDDRYIKAFATVKHFMANNSDSNRHNGDSRFDERSLREYYGYPFQQTVEENKVESIMTSYNRVNGIPATVNLHMLDELLRRTWGFDGYVVTDCDTLEDVVRSHPWRPWDTEYAWGNEWNELPDGWAAYREWGSKEAAALALLSGTDANCGQTMSGNAKAAIEAGLMSEDDIDLALVRLFTSRMKSGEFDPDEWVSYNGEDFQEGKQIQSEEHQMLAEEVGEEAVVLLKNDPAKDAADSILPLKGEEIDSLVVVGDYADEYVQGNYNPNIVENKSTPLEGIQKSLDAVNPNAEVTYISGTNLGNSKTYLRNVRTPEFFDENGNKLETPDWNENNGLKNCTIEDHSSYRNVGSMRTNSDEIWIKFDKFDFTGVKSGKIGIAGPDSAANTVMEIRGGGLDGQILGTVTADDSATGNWQSYREYDLDLKLSGLGYDKEWEDVYFVFRERTGDLGFSADEQQKIREADAVVAFVGTRLWTNGFVENQDAHTLKLDKGQDRMIEELAALNSRTIVYAQAASQIDVESFKNDVPAILWCCYNGQAQGNIAGRLLFGQSNPSGKLPITWYSDVKQLADVKDYQLRSDSTDGKTGNKGRTYQYFTGDVSYPFGHGLSYSEFEYSDLKLNKTDVTPNDTITVSFNITNKSGPDGKAVGEIYVVSPGADRVNRPAKRLKGFEKKNIPAGETVSFSVDIPMEDLFYWDEENSVQIYDEGIYTIEVGSSSDDKNALKAEFNLSGTLNPELNTVKAIPTGHILNTANPNKKIATKLSANRNDQSFVENPSVIYTSSNPEIAAVDENGNVTAVSGGVTTITASVTENGITKCDTYPVVVKEQIAATGLYLNGIQKLADFAPNKTEYTVNIADINDIPTVSATANAGYTVECKQATAGNLTAEVKVSRGSAFEIYKISFNIPANVTPSDFTQMNKLQVEEKWNIIRQNADNWNISGDGLTIKMEKGDLFNSNNTVRNLFVQKESPENWIVETEAELTATPSADYEQAGLLAYMDDGNYVKLSYENGNGGQIRISKEENGSFNNAFGVQDYRGTHVWLRLQKEGTTYTGWYSADGENFTQVDSINVPLQNTKIAFLACTGIGNGSSTPIDVTFKNIKAPGTEKTHAVTVKETDCSVIYETSDKQHNGRVVNGENVIFTVEPLEGRVLNADELNVTGTFEEVTKVENEETGVWTVTVTGAASDIELVVSEKEFDGNYVIRVNGEEIQKAPYNTKVTVTAPKAEEGQKFAGWKADSEDSDFISMDENYTFYVAGNINLIPVYVDADGTVEEKAQAFLSNLIVTNREDGKRNAKFVGQLVIPKDYKLLDAGLIWSSKSAEEVELIKDGQLNPDLKPTYIRAISDTNQFSVTIKGVPADRILRGRIFATVQAPDGSEEILVYSIKEGAVEALQR